MNYKQLHENLASCATVIREIRETNSRLDVDRKVCDAVIARVLGLEGELLNVLKQSESELALVNTKAQIAGMNTNQLSQLREWMEVDIGVEAND